MLLTLGTGCAALSGMKKPVDAGEFPPCPQVTTEEVGAIRSLTSYRTVEETEAKRELPLVQTDVRDSLVKRDQNLLNILGRVANWCKAYHSRIGYVENHSAPATAVAPEKAIESR